MMIKVMPTGHIPMQNGMTMAQFTHTSRTTTGSDGRTVYEAQFRRVDESGTSTSRNADANTPIYGRSVPPQSTVEAAEKQGKKIGAATALTVAGVALLICAMIALPGWHLLAA